MRISNMFFFIDMLLSLKSSHYNWINDVFRDNFAIVFSSLKQSLKIIDYIAFLCYLAMLFIENNGFGEFEPLKNA